MTSSTASSTRTVRSTRPNATAAAPSRARAAALLAAGVVVALIATSIVALAARAAGADGLAALQPAVYGAFVVLGFAAASTGWALVRRFAAHPSAVLRVLVPVLTVLSLVPDVALAVLGFIPGTTLVGAFALGLMHLVVVAVAVPVLARALPTHR